MSITYGKPLGNIDVACLLLNSDSRLGLEKFFSRVQSSKPDKPKIFWMPKRQTIPALLEGTLFPSDESAAYMLKLARCFKVVPYKRRRGWFWNKSEQECLEVFCEAT